MSTLGYQHVLDWFGNNHFPNLDVLTDRLHEEFPGWSIRPKGDAWEFYQVDPENWLHSSEWGRDWENYLSQIGFPRPPAGSHSSFFDLYQKGAFDWTREQWIGHQWGTPSVPEKWLDALFQWIDAGQPHGWYNIDTPGSVESELLWESGFRPRTPEGRDIIERERQARRKYHRERRKAFLASALSWSLPSFLYGLDMLSAWFNPFTWTSSKLTAGLAKAGFGQKFDTALAVQGFKGVQGVLQEPIYRQVAQKFIASGLESWLWGQGQQGIQRGIWKAVTGHSGEQAIAPELVDLPDYIQTAFKARQYVKTGRELMQGLYDAETDMIAKTLLPNPEKGIRLFREYYGLHPQHPLPNWNELVALLKDKDWKSVSAFRGIKFALQHYEKWVPSVIKHSPDFVKDIAATIAKPEVRKGWNTFSKWTAPLTAKYWADKMGYQGDLHWFWDIPFWFVPIPGTRVAKGLKVGKKLITSKKAQQIAKRHPKNRRVRTQAKWVPLPAQPLPEMLEHDFEYFSKNVIDNLDKIDLNWRHDRSSTPRSADFEWRGRVPYRFRRRRSFGKGFYNRKRYRRR